MSKELIIVTVSLGNDGAERVLTLLANSLIKKGYDITIIQTKPGAYGNSYNYDKNIKIVDFPYNGENGIWRYFIEAKQLHDYLKGRAKSTILAFLSQSIFITVLANVGLNHRLVVSERNDPRKCPANKAQRFIRNISFHFADNCVFQTKEVQRMFAKSIQKKSVVIPNPVNPQLPELICTNRDHRIVTACRLHPQKNLKLLLEAFALFSIKFSDYSLDIYGEGVLEEKLKAESVKLGIAERVKFHGFVNDLYSKIWNASMYICSSDYEGISNSILEAMALGIPTISTDCPVGGSRLLIDNYNNGILVPVNNVNELYRAMEMIALDSEFAKGISERAVNVRIKYSIDNITKEWEKLF